jgi:hypothetical protein
VFPRHADEPWHWAKQSFSYFHLIINNEVQFNYNYKEIKNSPIKSQGYSIQFNLIYHNKVTKEHYAPCYLFSSIFLFSSFLRAYRFLFTAFCWYNLKLAYIVYMRSYKLSNKVLLCFTGKVFVFVLTLPDHSSILYFPRAILAMVSQERHCIICQTEYSSQKLY